LFFILSRFSKNFRGELRPITPPIAAQSKSPDNSGGSVAAASVVPPPCRRASPTHNTIGRFTPFAPYSRYGRKPVINGSKGEGQPTAVAVGLEEEKNANVHVCIFFTSGGVLPPRRCGATEGRANPALLLVLHHSKPNSPHAKPERYIAR